MKWKTRAHQDQRLDSAVSGIAWRGSSPMSKSQDYANGTYTSFGIAIGYASNFLPEQNLWALAAGLSAAAILYLLVGYYEHELNRNYFLQIIALALAAIAPLTPKVLSAAWALVFIALGTVGVILRFREQQVRR